jgi:outer membrane protein assembly factor BamB
MTGEPDYTGATATGGGEPFNTESALSGAPTPEPPPAPTSIAEVARASLSPAVERWQPAPPPALSPAWPRAAAPDAAGKRARRNRIFATAGIVLTGIVIVGMFAAVFLLLGNNRPRTSSPATGASPTQTIAATTTSTPAPSPTAGPTSTPAPTPTLVPPGSIPQGTVLWHTPGSPSPVSLPAVANRAVYVGAHDGTLTAFDAHTGARLWSVQAGGAITTAPVALDGVVVVMVEQAITFENSIVAYRASDGSLAWRAHTAAVGYSAPVAASDLIIAESATNSGPATLHAFTPATGVPVWTQEVTGSDTSIIMGRPVPFTDGATVYVTENSTLFATRVSDHAVVWSKPVPGASFLGENGVLYVAGRPPAADATTADVVAYDSGAGTQLWTHTINSVGLDGMTLVAVGGGAVYAATDRGTLHALSVTTGNELWSFRAPARITPPGALYNGALYFAADGMYALDAATGAPRWHLVVVSGPPVAGDNIIYAGALYALKP